MAISEQAPVDGVRQPPFQAPQRFLGGFPFGALAPVVGLPAGGWRICTIAIRYSAWLSWRCCIYCERDGVGGLSP
jgi:hypothetical protein